MAVEKRPARYRLRVTTPEFTGHLLVEHGFCTAADPALLHCVGASAPWLTGHFIHRQWTATMLPAPEHAAVQGMLL